MKAKKFLFSFAILFIAFVSGCAKDDFEEVIGVCPIVESTTPLSNALGVPLSQIITATFNEEMDPNSITSTSFTVVGTTAISGTVSYSGRTATFTPTVRLEENTTYSARIKTNAKDVMGNALQTDYVWTFTTGMLLRPVIILTDPITDAIDVKLNKAITATFNMAMDPLTITGTTFTVKQGTNVIAGVITTTGTTTTFTPTNPLIANKIYTVTITNGIKNSVGTAMVNNYVWNFTTEIAPTVTATDPANNATGVGLNKTITATFSVPMDALTLTNTTFIVKHGTFVVVGAISYTGSTVSFTPTNSLVADMDYEVTITTGAKNESGLPLAANYVWDFRTGVAPTVTSTDPINNATGVALNKTVTANFSTAMTASTINATTFTLKQGTTVIPGNVSYTGTTASFNPTSQLIAGTIYTATITNGAKNLIGTPLASNYIWNFTTIATPPIVVVVDLASASVFGAFGGNAGITNQGLNTVINNGSIGTTAASSLITGFHDGTAIYTETPLNVGNVTGDIFAAPPAPGNATSFAIAQQGLLDATAAYLSISPASKPGGSDPNAGELGGLTLAPGIYKSASGTFKISNGNLTLDAQGDPNATWIFQTASGLTVGIAGPTGAKSVILTNGALAKNVFWYVGSAATINGAGGGTMVGTIIANSGVTFSTPGNATQTVLNGRAISLISSVTMVNTTINVPN
jgi:hypothetical protein